MPRPEPTHFERLICYLRRIPPWRKALLTLVLLALPIGLASLEGVQTTIFNQGGTWRVAYFPTVLVIYIVIVAPWIWRAEQAVSTGLQPLMRTGPSHDEMIAYRRWWRSTQGDWLAFGTGLVAGLLMLASSALPDLRYWAVRYWLGTTLIMYGGLIWLIYAAMGSARLTVLLHRNLLHQDPFDLAPFEPVGRQGLTLALIFVGAITLSLLFIYSQTMFLEWQGIVVYSILVFVTILIFFTVMWPAHRILQRVKGQKLLGVQRLIAQTFRRLETLAADGADTLPVATEVQAWLNLEQRLRQTRTWPYDTEMLRTLSFSVLTPLFVAVARVLGDYVTLGHF